MILSLSACNPAPHPSPPSFQSASSAQPTPQPQANRPDVIPSKANSAGKKKNRILILATTTSTQDSGLLDVLIPLFERQSGYLVKTVAVGSGQAIQMGVRGNADVLFVHDHDSEKKFMAEGYGKDRALVMHNDFLLVGPATDPAAIKGKSITAAFQAIAASQSTFVSRGDDSGTHKKELSLWSNIGQTPQGQSWYIETGQGMGASLTIAAEKGGYILTDRATFLAYRENVPLEILVDGDQALMNWYHVITVNPEKFPEVNYEAALAFLGFLTSPETQGLIGEFGIKEVGQPLFFPDADQSNVD
jgi:tungstate transport system substrate-binding protein